MASGAAIDSRPPSALGIGHHVRSNSSAAQKADKIAGVITLIGAQRGTRAHNKRANIREIQAMLGHENHGTISIYPQFLDETKRNSTPVTFFLVTN